MNTIVLAIAALVLAVMGVWFVSHQAGVRQRHIQRRDVVQRRAQALEANALEREELAKTRELHRQQILDHVRSHGGVQPVGFIPDDDIYSAPMEEDIESAFDNAIGGGLPEQDPAEPEQWDEWANGGEGVGTNNPSRGVNPVSRHVT